MSGDVRQAPRDPKKPGWAKAKPKPKPKPKHAAKALFRGGPPRDGDAERALSDQPARSRPASKRATPGRKHLDRKGRRRRDGDSADGSRPDHSGGPAAHDIERSGARTEMRPDSRAERGAPASTMRIAKAMARAGLCSRRDAERWIAEGRVEVNGTKLDSPARDVGPMDRVVVDGQPLPAAEPTRLWRYSKPKGRVTTHRDPEGRPTVFDDLAADMPRVLSVGRLDYNTEGLLLLTTDGELARYLELPATGWLRRYRVRAHVPAGARFTQADLDGLADGVSIDGIHYGPIEATLDSTQGSNVWLTLGLREGKNREVRKILASLGLEVNRLIRVSFGPFQLLDLEPGTVELVRRKVLVEQLGSRIARRFNLADDDDGAAERDRGGASGRATTERRDPDGRRPNRRPETRAGEDQDRRGRPAPGAANVRPAAPSGGTRSERAGGARTRGSQRAKETTDRAMPPVDVDESRLDDIRPWEAGHDRPKRPYRGAARPKEANAAPGRKPRPGSRHGAGPRPPRTSGSRPPRTDKP